MYASVSSKLWITTNGGTTWSSYSFPLGNTITSIDVSSTDPQKLWLTTNATTAPQTCVYQSNDAGVNFTNISGSLPSISARSVRAHGPHEGLYLGMNIGVYYRDTLTGAWSEVSGNLPKAAVNELEVHPGAGKLRVATYGRGIWETAVWVPKVYNFTGNGAWTDAANWSNGQVPPTVLEAGDEIVINPAGNGLCTLNQSQTISKGATLTVVNGKKLQVNGNLTVIR
jgi:photosystem II stability/assembly factor-like uncharacterized protein